MLRQLPTDLPKLKQITSDAMNLFTTRGEFSPAGKFTGNEQRLSLLERKARLAAEKSNSKILTIEDYWDSLPESEKATWTKYGVKRISAAE